MWRRDLFISLSLANLCFLRVWSELLTYTRGDTYLMKLPPRPVDYLAVMLNVLLVGGVLWAGMTFARRKFSKRALRSVDLVFLVFLVVPLNAVRAVLSNRIDLLRSAIFVFIGTRGVELILAGSAVVAAIGIVKFRRQAAHWAAAALVVLFPFCALTFGQALWKIAGYNPAGFAARPPEPPLAHARQSPRVLWVIADEWDYRLTFVDRPAGLKLPEIDRLRKDSLSAEQAYPPGWATPVSMPGYFTGKLVDDVRYESPTELQIHFRGAAGFEPWSRQPSIFTSAHALGFNTALVDWYHPGCRVLSGLTWCDWWEMARQFNSMGTTLGEIMPHQARSLFETTLTSLFGQSLSGQQQAHVYRESLREAIALANNREFGLSVVHLPVPHAPHAYDRRTGTFTLKNSPVKGYIDSLALLDRTVGEIRRAMESAGTWDSTTVLFTTDHHYREASALDGSDDARIPFLLKMAFDRNGSVYTESFNTVLTHDLILAILSGKVATAADVVRWLDTNRPHVPES